MAFDEEIKRRLEHVFGSERTLFWEDAESEFADSIEDLSIDGIQVIAVDGNEFAVKREVLRGRSSERILIYRAGGAPDRMDDYLLDIKIASRIFNVTQAAVWARECGIPDNLIDTINAHVPFFADKERRAALKTLCEKAEWFVGEPSSRDLELALVAVCCREKQPKRMDALRGIGKAVLKEYALDANDRWRLIDRCNLQGALWKALSVGFGYVSDAPSIEDFALSVVLAANEEILNEDVLLNAEAAILLSSLSRDRSEEVVFENLIEKTADFVQEKSDYSLIDRSAIIANQYLPNIDDWLIGVYAQSILDGVDCADELKSVIARRKSTFWYKKASWSYEALFAATEFNVYVKEFEIKIDAVDSVLSCYSSYTGNWWRIDEAYRRFRLAMRPDNLGSLAKISSILEPRYGSFLAALARKWQDLVLKEGVWPPASIRETQRGFYRFNVARAGSGTRVAVIISDGLRYESAMQLNAQFKKSNLSCEVKSSSMLSVVPSYTQLGMAALLPGKDLFFDTGTQNATVDGKDATGTKNREKILTATVVDAKTVLASELLTGTISEGLDEAPLVYVYHNKVDKIGDSRDSEREVFDAVQIACDQVENLASILIKMGYERIFITADHGFLYQDAEPSSFEYASVDLLDVITSADDARQTRRFVAAPDLPKYDDVIYFDSSSLGLTGDFKVGIPKGIRRFKLRGSGARFVHGGITLQETVIPLIELTARKRSSKSKTQPVGAEILTGGKQVISGATVSFQLLQAEPVSNERPPQHVRIGVYSEDGSLVSSEEELDLDSSVEDAGSRKIPIQLMISPSLVNGSKVTLRVEGRYGTTSHYSTVASVQYTIRRNFGMDF